MKPFLLKDHKVDAITAGEEKEGSLQIELDDEPKPGEAWRSVQRKYSRTSIVSMLLMIGKSSLLN